MNLSKYFGFALLVLVAAATACTPSTCPKGPVRVWFSEMDCLGTPEFGPYGDHLGQPMSTCFYDNGKYKSYNVTSEGVEEYEGDSASCSTADPTSDYTIHFRFFLRLPPKLRRRLPKRHALAISNRYLLCSSRSEDQQNFGSGYPVRCAHRMPRSE